MSRKLTTEQFTELANLIHSDKYSYLLCEYVDNKTKVEILCPFHSSFWKTPAKHVLGKQGCPTCSKLLKASLKVCAAKDKFKSKAESIHGTIYDYSKVDYKSATDNVEIICKEHSSFFQTPNTHLNGSGCTKCSIESRSNASLKSQEDFIQDCIAVHGTKYDYSESVYAGAYKTVKIKCPEHGLFEQNAIAHSIGKGCRKCMKAGFQPNKSGYLYILSSGDVTKVGITNHPVSIRASAISKSAKKKFSVDFFIKFEDGVIPDKLEKILLKELRLEYSQTVEYHDGYTECFVDVDRDKLLLRVSQICAEAFSAINNLKKE